MGYLTLTRTVGEHIRLTIDPGVDTEKLLQQLLRDGITLHVEAVQSDRVRVAIEAPKQIGIYRSELLDGQPLVGAC